MLHLRCKKWILIIGMPVAFTSLFPSIPTPLTEAGGEDAFEAIKHIAKNDMGILKQVAYLYKLYHGDDPRFTKKESHTAMTAILSALYASDPRSAFYMGSMDWTPNLPVWMRFFDMVKPGELGSYLEIYKPEEIPSFDADETIAQAFK